MTYITQIEMTANFKSLSGFKYMKNQSNTFYTHKITNHILSEKKKKCFEKRIIYFSLLYQIRKLFCIFFNCPRNDHIPTTMRYKAQLTSTHTLSEHKYL